VFFFLLLKGQLPFPWIRTCFTTCMIFLYTC